MNLPRTAARVVARVVATLALVLLVTRADRARADEEEPAPSWPERIGPFEIATSDDAARLRVGAAAQLRLELDHEELAGGADTTDVEITIPRLRTDLRAYFLERRIEARIQLELTPSHPELIDVYVEATIAPELHLSAGQLKIPFTLYRQQSYRDLGTTDWPVTARVFGAERQLGLMAHDQTADRAGFAYAVGIFAGENRRDAHARELPRLYGENGGNPSSLTDPRPPGPLHAELVGRIAHLAPDVGIESNFDGSGAPTLRHAVALSAAWDTSPEHRRDFLLRVAPELLLKYAGWSLAAVGYLGLTETLDGSTIPAALGAFAEVGWQPDRHLQLAVRYAGVLFTDELRSDLRAYAASLDSPDPDPHAAWEAQYGDVGHVRARHELGLGVTVPIIGRGLAWQSDVTWLRTERDDGARDDVRVRTQLQVAF